MIVSAKIVKIFLSANKISLFRTYLAVLYLKSGKLSLDTIAMLSRGLKCSKSHIKKQLDTLVEMGLLQKGYSWYFVVGNARYKYLNNSIGKDAIRFNDVFNAKLNKIDLETGEVKSKEQFERDVFESIKDLKKLRTYLHISLQENISRKFLKGKDTTVTGVYKLQPEYNCSASYLSEVFKADKELSKNFSKSTIRKHKLRGDKFKYLTSKRVFNVIFATEGFVNFIQSDNSYKLKKKKKFILTETQILDRASINTVYPTLENKRDKYSPIMEWYYKGKIVAVVQEMSALVRFKFEGCKFSYKSKNFDKTKSYKKSVHNKVKEETIEQFKSKKSKKAILTYEVNRVNDFTAKIEPDSFLDFLESKRLVYSKS